MWLRDSANQISAYLHLLKGLPSESWTALYRLVLGVVYTQAACILHYPFANAFLPPTSPVEAENTDHVLPRIPPSIRDKKGTRCGIGVWEAKFELDSLASFIDLSAKVLAIRSDLLYNPAWIDAVELVLEVCQAQQRGTDEEAAILHKQAYQQDHDTPTHSDHGRKGASSIYRFNRETRTASETRSLSGLGEPARRCGESCTLTAMKMMKISLTESRMCRRIDQISISTVGRCNRVAVLDTVQRFLFNSLSDSQSPCQTILGCLRYRAC